MSQTAAQGDVFAVMLAGLEQFQRRVDGTEGDYRARLVAIADEKEIIPNLAKAVLETIMTLLVQLHAAMVRLPSFALQADSALALVSVFASAVRAMSEALDRQWPPELAALGNVTHNLHQFGDGPLRELEAVDQLAAIPSPETLEQIRQTTLALVGTKAEASAPVGSLEALLADLAEKTPDRDPAH
jgi:hypothetical protein